MAQDVGGHPDPLVKRHAQDVERRKVLDDPVTARFLVQLGLEGAEQLVPDNQDAGVIAVEVPRVTGVVDPVVRGRVEHGFEPDRQPSDGLRMDPVLIDQADPFLNRDHRRREAQKRQRQPERPGPGQTSRPSLPQSRRQIVVLGGVVIDMRRPPEAPLMTETMEPVVGQILQQDQRHPGPDRRHRNVEDAILPGPDRRRRGHAHRQQTGDAREQPHAQRNRRIPRFIVRLRLAKARQHDLQDDRDDEQRRRHLNRVERLHAARSFGGHEGNAIVATGAAMSARSMRS